jgi:hypothetical protein
MTSNFMNPTKAGQIPAQRPGESDFGYQLRIQPWLKAAAYAEAEQQIDAAAADHRARTGVDRGLFASPLERSALYAGTGYGAQGFGSGREIVREGGVGADISIAGRPASNASVMAVMREREAAQRAHAQQARRTDVSQIRPSGAGLIITN